jgi:methionine-R-sulfoxide reductase
MYYPISIRKLVLDKTTIVLFFIFLQLSLFPIDGFRVQSISSVRSNGKIMEVHSCRYYNNGRSSSSSSSSSSSRNKGLMLKMTEDSNPSSSSSSSSPSETKKQQQQEGRLRPVEKTDEEWKEVLTPEQYYILRKEGTEAPNSSILNKISVEKNGKEDKGSFICAGCKSPLFVANAKFDSGTGWPSFFAPITSSAVDLNTDYKLIVPRTEVTCSQCGGHLGHVFDGKDCAGCLTSYFLGYVLLVTLLNS